MSDRTKGASSDDERLILSRAVAVEGRDDVAAVGRALDALVIPTHGFGIARETWEMLDRAYAEKGLIILTDPDHAGEQIRKRLSEKYPDALQAYVARDDAADGDDIGVENASPEAIREAIETALSRAGADEESTRHAKARFAEMSDLRDLGLAGGPGASEARARVCKSLGIGYGNAQALIKKLRGFGIDIDELKEAVEKTTFR